MSSEAWQLVDAVEEVVNGSQQVHIDACQIRAMSNWNRIVSVARHYYRLRNVMGTIGLWLKENKQFARNELFDQFPEVDPKRVEREAKAAQRKRSPHPKYRSKEASVVYKSRSRATTIKQRLHQVKRGTSTDSGISKSGASVNSGEKVVSRSSKQGADFVRVVTDTGVKYISSRSSKQVAVADSSVPSVVIAEIQSGHYKGTHWYNGKRVVAGIENSHYQ